MNIINAGPPYMTCVSAPCHEAGGQAPPPPETALDLSPNDNLYSTLMSYVAKDCNNETLVVPGHPEKSAIVKILSGPCSSTVPQMPKGCSGDSCIPQTYVDAISAWITNGAPQN